MSLKGTWEGEAGLVSEHDSQLEEKAAEAIAPTRRAWFRRVAQLFERSRIDDELWDELEEFLIAADVGVGTATKVLDRLRARTKDGEIRKPEEARVALKEELISLLKVDASKGFLAADGEKALPKPFVVLVVGVNGTGKTTSIAKLAWSLKSEGRRVILVAADTFRAAAIDQLRQWGQRVGAEVIAHREGADPGAVVFDALSAAEARGADAVIIDTAGRLHTKANLMEELGKIVRVIKRKDPSAPHDVLLVLDATIGQNALLQAKYFTEAVDVTGILLAKLDGSGKGGIIFAICDQLGIPVLFIGAGEQPQDLAPFAGREFVEAVFSQPGADS